MCAKGLKRAGYCVFGYREYMSLIKGGHSSYQLDVSNELIGSSETTVDVLVCFNHHGLEINLVGVKEGGVVLHQSPQWKFSPEQKKIIDQRKISVIEMPTEEMLTKLKAPPILGNVLITSVVWSLLGRDGEELKNLVKEQFGHKGEKLLAMNFSAIDTAIAWAKEKKISDCWKSELPAAEKRWKDHLLLTGSEAMGLGVIHAGCRLYAGYPMTPSSPLLTFIAAHQNETGMIVKQAEDEITAAQIMSGAMLMGTRAMTATSGGGFDLMTETVSLNAIIENPSVFVLAQRPGPATGLPTWTAQGDLLLATHSAHGEFPRLVLAASNTEDSFALMSDAFNYAEEFQIPVIILTDKHLAEGIFTEEAFDQKKTKLMRGKLVTSASELKKLKSTDRYDPKAKDGVSPRWLPGAKAATFCSQGDEHNADGSVDETAANAAAQMEKRQKKMEALARVLPEPEYTGPKNPDVLVVSWGSNRGVIADAMNQNSKIGYLHYTHLWPLKTKTLTDLASKAKKTVLVECNHQGQLGMLIKQECGLDFDHKILKYDGRPFFYDELVQKISSLTARR
jgi:2-oxoglutarate ferredoxin oxidoreductase subunit alpha